MTTSLQSQQQADLQEHCKFKIILRITTGIGKTAFAYALARMCRRRGCPAVILDSRDFEHDPAALSDAVAVRRARARAWGSDQPVLLVLDTFEEMQDMERAFWDVFLPALDGPVLLALSGRHAPPAPAASARWRGLVDELELRPLSAAESRRLLRHHGVRDRADADSIAAVAKGNPLLLAVAAQHARTRGSWDADLTKAVAQSLIGRMTSESADPGVRGLLAAASLVRTFNQVLLAAMTGRDMADSFAGLCNLSVVRVLPAGARLHDLVREWVAADLAWRAPAACKAMRRRAHAYLARAAAASPEPGPHVQELLHLAAVASPQARFYAASSQAYVRVQDADPRDLPRLRELCRTGITRFGIPAAERIRQLESDFDAAREFFAVALDDGGSITGFAYTVPLCGTTWQAAAKTRALTSPRCRSPRWPTSGRRPTRRPGQPWSPGPRTCPATSTSAPRCARPYSPRAATDTRIPWQAGTPPIACWPTTAPSLLRWPRPGSPDGPEILTSAAGGPMSGVLRFGDHGFAGWTAWHLADS